MSLFMSLEFINPQLASPVDHPPPRAGWIHEVKHDGYRTLLIMERRKVRAYTRNGFDWTERYTDIARGAAKLECRSALIDGEVIFRMSVVSRILRRSSRLSGGVLKA
jgi:bifunctional non-homologous end joining protein LigD